MIDKIEKAAGFTIAKAGVVRHPINATGEVGAQGIRVSTANGTPVGAGPPLPGSCR